VTEDTKVIQWIPKDYTNNEMEYFAVIVALMDYAREGDIVKSDSRLVVNQVNGLWKINEERLRKLCNEAKAWLDQKKCKLEWIPRAMNSAGFLIEKGI
jgi:ribonuclease HI